MRAEIVAVGTEILLGDIVDTNSAELGKAFARHGISHLQRQSVGDNLARLTEALNLALSRADLVFTIGGLGPTVDDMTRDGIAAALEQPLVEDPEVRQHLIQLFEKRRLNWTESQLRQAQRPSEAEVVPNPNGTAPGLICRSGKGIIVAMPGPKNEFVPMLEGPIEKLLAELGDGTTIHSKTIKVAGIGEAALEQQLVDLMESANPTLAPYAKTSEVHLRVTASAATEAEAEALIAPVIAQVQERVGRYVYGFNDETLASAVIRDLAARGETLAVAESCTGGGLGAMLTSIAGSSDVFQGGVISYSNEAKARELGVHTELIEEFGAVSDEVARAMAEGLRERWGVTHALSITGVAGPGGGTEEKPVGLVFVAHAGPKGTRVTRSQFPGLRSAVRERAGKSALILLRSSLV
jgi:nicotinamide-nucleotide amidase